MKSREHEEEERKMEREEGNVKRKKITKRTGKRNN